MGSKIKRSLFKYLIISLTISIILSIAVQDAAQNISDNIQLKYTDSSKLYEYQNGYSQLFGDVPQIPDVSPEIMIPSDRIAKELCDFISSWCILFFTLFGVFLSLTLFYKRRLKTPFSVLNEAADKISRQDLDFKISYVYAPQQRGGCQDLLRSRNCFYAFKIFSQCIVGADWKYCVYCYGRKMIDIHSLIFSCGGDMIKERRLKTMRITKEPEVRKQEILDTALKLFGENGYEKTSITDIAKAIGVAQGLCYRYFPSKEALFDSAIEQYADVLVEQFADAETDDRKTLRQIIEEMPATMEKQDTKYYSVFHGTENRKFHDQLALKVCEKLVPLVEKLLQRAKQKGEIHFDDLQAAATFCVYGQLGILLADDLTQEDKSKRIREFLIFALHL